MRVIVEDDYFKITKEAYDLTKKAFPKDKYLALEIYGNYYVLKARIGDMWKAVFPEKPVAKKSLSQKEADQWIMLRPKDGMRERIEVLAAKRGVSVHEYLLVGIGALVLADEEDSLAQEVERLRAEIALLKGE